jgi:hypothetical protein
MTDGFLNSKRFTELGEKISAIHQKKRRIKV